MFPFESLQNERCGKTYAVLHENVFLLCGFCRSHRKLIKTRFILFVRSIVFLSVFTFTVYGRNFQCGKIIPKFMEAILFLFAENATFVVTYTSGNKSSTVTTTSPSANVTGLPPGLNFTVTVDVYVNNGTLVGKADVASGKTGEKMFLSFFYYFIPIRQLFCALSYAFYFDVACTAFLFAPHSAKQETNIYIIQEHTEMPLNVFKYCVVMCVSSLNKCVCSEDVVDIIYCLHVPSTDLADLNVVVISVTTTTAQGQWNELPGNVRARYTVIVGMWEWLLETDPARS